TFSLTNVILADPLVRAYSLRSYQVVGMLSQNVVTPTLSQRDIFATSVYIGEHSPLDPTEAAQASQVAYYYNHPLPTAIPVTPVIYSFQTPDDIPGLILADPNFISDKNDNLADPCQKSGTPGKALYVKSLDPTYKGYYFVPFYLNGKLCSGARFYTVNSHAGLYVGFGGGISITADEAKAMFENAGYSIVGEPYLVFGDTDNPIAPIWQAITQDNQTLDIRYSNDIKALVVSREPTSNQP
ncbi:MAG: hypothetical protein WCE68_13420, partial [Anaerolineales bacterium]